MQFIAWDKRGLPTRTLFSSGKGVRPLPDWRTLLNFRTLDFRRGECAGKDHRGVGEAYLPSIGRNRKRVVEVNTTENSEVPLTLSVAVAVRYG